MVVVLLGLFKLLTINLSNDNVSLLRTSIHVPRAPIYIPPILMFISGSLQHNPQCTSNMNKEGRAAGLLMRSDHSRCDRESVVPCTVILTHCLGGISIAAWSWWTLLTYGSHVGVRVKQGHTWPATGNTKTEYQHASSNNTESQDLVGYRI